MAAKKRQEITAAVVLAALEEIEVVVANLKVVFGTMPHDRVLAIGSEGEAGPAVLAERQALPPRVGPVTLVGAACRPTVLRDDLRRPGERLVEPGGRPSGRAGKSGRRATAES